MNLRNQKQYKQIFPFFYTSNSNSLHIHNTIKSSVDVLKRNNVPGFQNIKHRYSKRQPSNLRNC